MGELGVDVLLLSLGADLPWLTGYRAMPLERLTMLVLPRDGEAVLVRPRARGAAGARTRPGCSRCGRGPRPRTPSTSPPAWSVPAGRATVGVSDRAWAGAAARAAGAPARRASWQRRRAVTAPLRAVKDAGEIAALRAAAPAADRVAARAPAAAGSPSSAAARRRCPTTIGAHLVAEGHDRVNFAIVGSGPNGASPHHEPGARVIGPGEVVVCDFGGELRVDDGVGYCSDITRTVVTGEPGAEVRDCYAVLLAAQQAGVAAARRRGRGRGRRRRGPRR